MPLSVDEKKVALVPNSPSDLKASLGLQVGEVDPCHRVHSLLPFTLQKVNPLLSPVTVHPKVNLSSGQVGGAAVNSPAT